RDIGESGLAGVTITLRNSGGSVITTTTTAGDGSYSFNGLIAGNYTVEETDPSGFSSTTPNSVAVILTVGGTATASFGDRQIVLLPVLAADKSSTRVVDADGNGRTSPGDTLQYQIVISNSGNTPATTVVFADTLDSDTTLVVGSVQTSAGTVGLGNTSGSTSVRVDIGTLANGSSVTITFRARINSPFPVNRTSVINQGVLTSDQLGPILTNDPATGATGDPTATPIFADPTVVVLTNFSARWEGNTMVVRWATAAERDTRGFHLLRSSSGEISDAVRVTSALIGSQGESGGSYSFTDTTAIVGQVYSYWLEEIELDGTRLIYGPTTSVQLSALPVRVVLPFVGR
ncbi:MAG TPA: SdrD B-like domain-containing protein, partial [Roseiflexaceae bacterium]|nr:SdrD B-like domain-containing protein [Roseiflexaceae bacterium]